MKTANQTSATPRPFSPIANLCGDAHIMGLSQKIICEANAEHAALVAVAQAARELAATDESQFNLMKINRFELGEALANLAAVRQNGGC